MRNVIPIDRAKKVYYASGVDMRFGFENLAAIAEQQLGASLGLGDVCVFDNGKQTRRKALIKTKSGFLMVYGFLSDGKFVPMNESDGIVRGGASKQIFQ